MRQNRVTPLSELIATPSRGLVYGNRGCLHDDTGQIRRRYNGRRWISCRLQFKDWKRSSPLQPGTVGVLRTEWESLVPVVHPSADAEN